MSTLPSYFRACRVSATVFAALLILFCSNAARSQQRSEFSALGNSAISQNFSVSSSNGATYYSTNTESVKATIKSEIAAQKGRRLQKG